GTEVAGGSDPTNPLSIPTPAGPVTVLDPPPVEELPGTDGLPPLATVPLLAAAGWPLARQGTGRAGRRKRHP
ncbi:MAG: hypothetical protein ACREJ4_04165, partial [Candidatus Methylomirabilaceae bacterium]